MELKYTPKTIYEIEKESGRPIQDTLSNFSMETIILFIKKGLGVDEEKAFEEIQTYLAEGNDTVLLYTLIMERLQDGGFLPRQLNMKKIRDDMQKAIAKGV